MCKAADRAMRIGDIRLVRKSGGKSGDITLE
jgi:cyclic pyranopterin phosphate synthase